MTIHISGRGVIVSPVLRRRVEAKVAKLHRLLPKISEARVVLGRERYRHLVEVTLQAKGTTLRAETAAADFHTALDEALESLEHQVRRRKDRITTRKPRVWRRPPGGAPAPAVETMDDAPALAVRRVNATPMSVDEAIEQIRVRGEGLLVFTNAESRVVNVLRRVGDGELELVEPGG